MPFCNGPCDLDPNTGQPSLAEVAPSRSGIPQRTPSRTSSPVSYDLSENNTDPNDSDTGFTEVVGRRNKRNRQNSSGRNSTVTSDKPVKLAALTVLLSPGDALAMGSISRAKLSASTGSLASGLMSEIRANQRKNAIAVDAATPETCAILLQQTSLCGVQVRAYIPRSINSLAGVIRNVDHDVSVVEVTSLVRADAEVLNVHQLGESRTIPIISAGNRPPTHVKAGYVRYPVWPYEGRPLQCTKGHKLGHVAASCINGERCTKYAGSHITSACTSEQPKCINCGKPHDPTSPACAYLRREKDICKLHSHEPLTYSHVCSVVTSKQKVAAYLKGYGAERG